MLSRRSSLNKALTATLVLFLGIHQRGRAQDSRQRALPPANSPARAGVQPSQFAQPVLPAALPPDHASPGQPAMVLSQPSILGTDVRPIDLNTALRLAGVQNPELNLARQRVIEAEALRQLAASQFLPSLNLGANYDSHNGTLQQSNGNILSLNRNALYVGAGANAIAAGSVNIPGIVLQGNVAELTYGYLVSRQIVKQQAFTSVAVQNQVFLQVALAYSELTRAEGALAIARQARSEAREIARLTADYAATGEGKPSDANRAATELAFREAAVKEAEGRLLVASAELCRVLNLDPSVRLHATDALVVPMPIVPSPMPLPELIAVGLLHRPELGERRAAIRASMLSLEGAKVLPFSPTVLIGFSAGGFGGGSNLVTPTFGGFGGRADLDAIGFWTIRNLGVGNVALIRSADAQLRATRFQEIGVLNMVRSEVAEAYAKSHARFAQIATTESAVKSGLAGFKEDYDRVYQRGREVEQTRTLPIELLDNFRMLARARREYLDSIVDYNRAQFELFVAMGQPPANVLAHPVPVDGYAPSGIPKPATNPASAPPAASGANVPAVPPVPAAARP